MRQIFDELDHRMSVIPRWSIVRTIHQQSNAEHCFNVARIAVPLWNDYLGGRSDMTADVYEWALHHDDEEVFTGDIQSPVGPYFNKERFRFDHKHLLRVPKPINSDVANCVKLADLMEMVHFMGVELQLGNRMAKPHWDMRVKKMYDFANEKYEPSLDVEELHRLNRMLESFAIYWLHVESRVQP